MRWTQAQMRALVAEERTALGLGPLDPFDPYELCAEHGIAVYPVDELGAYGADAEAIEHLTGPRASKWSAALVPLGPARIIIENPVHSRQRRRSNVAHELGHFLLEHDFRSFELGDEHTHQFDAAQEKQAKFMSAELLITEDAAKRAAFGNLANEDVAAHYDVSLEFAQMRMAGARKFAQHALARQARRQR